MINAYEQYRQGAVTTATPEGLTLMLYEGLIRFIKQGKLFIEQNKSEQAHLSIIRAQDILTELNTTLNLDYGISEQLRSLYLFMFDLLLEANIKKDENILEQVLPFAEELRDTWKEAVRIVREETKTAVLRA